jgi:hypothetical protein
VVFYTFDDVWDCVNLTLRSLIFGFEFVDAIFQFFFIFLPRPYALRMLIEIVHPKGNSSLPERTLVG